MIKIQETVKRETLRVAAGTAVLTVLMVAVFLLLGFFDWTVLLGAVYGCFFASLNFFLMAVGVQTAVEKMNGVTLPPDAAAEDDGQEDEKKKDKKQELPQQKAARRVVQWSYFLRMALLAGAAILAVLVSAIDPIAAVIPLFFPRLTITLQQMLQKNRKGE